MLGLAICKIVLHEKFDRKSKISKSSINQSSFKLALLKISCIINIIMKRKGTVYLKGFIFIKLAKFSIWAYSRGFMYFWDPWEVTIWIHFSVNGYQSLLLNLTSCHWVESLFKICKRTRLIVSIFTIYCFQKLSFSQWWKMNTF